MLANACLGDTVDLYDRLAPDYARLHRRWLRYAGGEAQAALEAAVRALATPDAKLLDAGCGVGAFARALIAEGAPPERITLLDPSDAMLARCADLPVMKLKGRLEAMPVPDGAFDLVTCAWALETTSRPDVALAELCRVLRRGGALCLAFCADAPTRGVMDWVLRRSVVRSGAGRFLSRGELVDALTTRHGLTVRSVPCGGPASALIARKGAAGVHRSPTAKPSALTQAS